MKLTKLTKLTKLILWIIYYCAIAGIISLIYVFRENHTILIILIVVGILFLILGGYISYKNKDIKQENVKTMTANHKEIIMNYINKNDEFEFDDTRYIKYVKFNGLNVLETFDFKSFKPISGRKRGIKLFNGDQVIKYLKNVKSESK